MCRTYELRVTRETAILTGWFRKVVESVSIKAYSRSRARYNATKILKAKGYEPIAERWDNLIFTSEYKGGCLRYFKLGGSPWVTGVSYRAELITKFEKGG